MRLAQLAALIHAQPRLFQPLLDAPALGSVHAAAVIDTATGKQLYARGAATPMTPASTVKIATAATEATSTTVPAVAASR